MPSDTRRRIAIIGAGSAYMGSVIRGLIARADTLAPADLVFHDVDTEHRDLLARLGAAMFRSAATDYRIEVADTLDRAVAGADFVFTTFRAGFLTGRYLDESISNKFGLIGQETIGPGGFFHALRSVPAMLDVVEQVQRHAPDAWIVNYTNPTNIVTDAVRRHGGYDRILGLCDQYVHDSMIWAQALGLPEDGLEIDWFGTNHATVATTVRSRGDDVSDLVRSRLAEMGASAMRDPHDAILGTLGRDFGVLVNHYFRYFYAHDEELRAQLAKPLTRAQEVMALLPPIYANYAEEAEREHPNPDASRGGPDWGEFAVDTMCAVAGNEGRRMIMNTRNDGTIPELEADAIVEAPAIVDADGIHPQPMGALPHPVRGLIHHIHEYERMAADAAATGDRGIALQALLAHPLMRSRTTAVGLLDAGLAAHREFLPQF